MVSRITRNPILKGIRVRNAKIAKRINQTGRRKSANAPPEERLERFCPHLAFFESEYYDRVVNLLAQRNAKYRAGKDGNDPRRNRPTKHSPWPGQHIFCSVCGRQYLHSGLRTRRLLMCRGACEYKCWNAVTINATTAAEKLFTAVRRAIVELPDFDERVLQLIVEERDVALNERDSQLEPLRRQLRDINRRLDNVSAAIAAHGYSVTLGESLKTLEAERTAISGKLSSMESAWTAAAGLTLPGAATIRELAISEFGQVPDDSPRFARSMRRLIDRIEVVPWRLLDDGAVVLRARFTLNLTPLLPGAAQLQVLSTCLRRELNVDLFDLPQRVRFRTEVLSLRDSGLTERAAAERLGITSTAAQRAASLDRVMRERGLSDPYVLITEPQGNYAKLRRHRHPRFRFEPLPKD